MVLDPPSPHISKLLQKDVDSNRLIPLNPISIFSRCLENSFLTSSKLPKTYSIYPSESKTSTSLPHPASSVTRLLEVFRKT
ncbi:MAG: hypothetical protein QXJ45_04970 [Thermoproteota archaeon]